MKNPQLDHLRKAVATAPGKPGIYRWLDPKGEVLYVGKALSIRSRLRSYVGPKGTSQGPWKESLMKKAAAVEWTVTRNELEALILETNLIKELRPKYNVMMKDGKNYVYVRISIRDEFPSVSIVRQLEEDGAEYFGPYLQKWQIERLLDFLHEVFPFKASLRVLQALNARARDGKSLDEPLTKSESWEIQIGKHCALGTGAYTHEQYREAIEAIMRFLRGDRAEAKAALREAMAQAAVDKKFERAARLRDALLFIEELAVPQNVSDTSGANTDAIGIAMQTDQAQVMVVRERGGKIIGEEYLKLSGRAESEAEVLRQAILQYYQTATDIPETILIGHELEDQAVVEAWLRMMRDQAVQVCVPERGKKSKLLQMAERNAEERARRERAAWEIAAHAVEDALQELQTVLQLPALPARIEGYDISHLGGTETVGSLVVFKNGKAANSEYRSFTIRTLTEGQVDDYAALREVLKRRLCHLAGSTKIEAELWKAKGITFGKAKKSEAKRLDEIVNKDSRLTPAMIDYREFLVARRGEDIIGCVRLHKHPTGTVELKSLWVAQEERGSKLGQVLLRKLLARVKKGKVYAACHPDLEEYYVNVGFHPIYVAPPVIQERLDKEAKEFPERRPAFIGHYETSKNKPDVSLSARPDLIMIDGGKGQLSTAVSALKAAGYDIPVIGLAKREEEIFRPGESLPILLPKESQGRFLLMRLRDEAHRFANRHREKRLKTTSVRSALDALPGIGDKTKQALIKHFGDLPGILAADDGALLRVVNRTQLRALRQLRV